MSQLKSHIFESPLGWIGLLVSLGGLAVLLVPQVESGSLLPSLFMAISGVAWGAYTMIGRSAGAPGVHTARSFAIGALLALPGCDCQTLPMGERRKRLLLPGAGLLAELSTRYFAEVRLWIAVAKGCDVRALGAVADVALGLGSGWRRCDAVARATGFTYAETADTPEDLERVRRIAAAPARR